MVEEVLATVCIVEGSWVTDGTVVLFGIGWAFHLDLGNWLMELIVESGIVVVL